MSSEVSAGERFYLFVLEEYVKPVLVMFQNAFQELPIDCHANHNNCVERKGYLSLAGRCLGTAVISTLRRSSNAFGEYASGSLTKFVSAAESRVSILTRSDSLGCVLFGAAFGAKFGVGGQKGTALDAMPCLNARILRRR